MSELTSFTGLSIAARHLLLLDTQRYYTFNVILCKHLAGSFDRLAVALTVIVFAMHTVSVLVRWFLRQSIQC